MAHLIDKDDLIKEIERKINEINLDSIEDWRYRLQREHDIEVMENIFSIIDTLEVKEVDLNDKKIVWSPSKKQMESLKDMLKWNIGDFNYQKWMEVNSLYEDLTKISDYETDR